MRVTGNMVNYFFVCKRKLWLFQHQIGFEQTSERVQLGSLLDRTSYKGKGIHHVLIDNLIDIDMIENWQLVHEVKRSDAIEPAAVWQLKYYIYYLRKKGINISKGLLDYPRLKKCVKIDYTGEDEQKMEQLVQKLNKFVNKLFHQKQFLSLFVNRVHFMNIVFLR